MIAYRNFPLGHEYVLRHFPEVLRNFLLGCGRHHPHPTWELREELVPTHRVSKGEQEEKHLVGKRQRIKVHESLLFLNLI